MQHKEKLSAYMDGYDVDNTLTQEIATDPELKQKWANYHAIRSVMQGDEILLGGDFSAKMEALIENEQIEPKKQGLLLKLKRFSSLPLQVGIAASVCLAVVLGVNTFTNNNEATVAQAEPTLQTIPFSDAVQAVSYNAPAQNQPTADRLEQQQRLLNSLLQNYELQRRTNANAVTLSEEQKAKAQTSSTVEQVK